MDYGYIVKILGSLVLVILMIVAMLYLMKRFSFKGSVIQGNVRILSALNIGPRERIMLIQAGEEQILVGSTPSSIRPLHVLRENVETGTNSSGDESSSQPNMKEILASLMGKGGTTASKPAKSGGDS